MLWPSGAAAQIRASLAETYRAAADALSTETRSAVVTSADDAAAAEALRSAQANAALLDDAFRSYLSERGAKPYPVHELTVAANGARRGCRSPPRRSRWRHLRGRRTPVPSPALRRGDAGRDATGAWYREQQPRWPDRHSAAPVSAPPIAERAVLAAVTASLREPPAADFDDHARTLWEIALHVDGTTRLQTRLVPHLTALAEEHRTTRSRGVRLSAGRRPGCRRNPCVRSAPRASRRGHEISSTLHTTVYTVSALAWVDRLDLAGVAGQPTRSMTSLFPVASSFSIRATRSCREEVVPSPRVFAAARGSRCAARC